MKKILLFIFGIYLIGCSKQTAKDSPQIVSKGTASYGAGAITNSWNASYYPNYKVDSINGHTSCLLGNFRGDDYSGLTYTFGFVQSGTGAYPLIYGINFTIPDGPYTSFNFPLNTPLIFEYSPSHYKSIASVCSVTFSGTESLSFFDSAKITVTFSRISNNSIDGTFSGDFYREMPPATASLRNGVFANVPITTD